MSYCSTDDNSQKCKLYLLSVSMEPAIQLVSISKIYFIVRFVFLIINSLIPFPQPKNRTRSQTLVLLNIKIISY